MGSGWRVWSHRLRSTTYHILKPIKKSTRHIESPQTTDTDVRKLYTIICKWPEQFIVFHAATENKMVEIIKKYSLFTSNVNFIALWPLFIVSPVSIVHPHIYTIPKSAERKNRRLNIMLNEKVWLLQGFTQRNLINSFAIFVLKMNKKNLPVQKTNEMNKRTQRMQRKRVKEENKKKNGEWKELV